MQRARQWVARTIPVGGLGLAPVSPAPAPEDGKDADCKIEVRSRRLRGARRWTGARHLFIVYTGSDGTEMGFRGGPSERGLSSSFIATRVGPYDPSFIDWDPRARSKAVKSGPAAHGKDQNLANEALRIDQARIPYKVLGPNSNTVVRTLLQKCDVPLEKPRGWHPGWNHPLL